MTVEAAARTSVVAAADRGVGDQTPSLAEGAHGLEEGHQRRDPKPHSAHADTKTITPTRPASSRASVMTTEATATAKTRCQSRIIPSRA